MTRETDVPGRAWHHSPGPHRPLADDVDLRARSVRRTTCHDTRYPDGPDGPAFITATARDAVVDEHGVLHEIASAAITANVDGVDRIVSGIGCTPDHPGIGALDGSGAGGGFRKRVDAALADLPGTGDLRYQLLDDLSGVTIVGAYPQARAGRRPSRFVGAIDSLAGQCAGWAPDTEFMVGFRRDGMPSVAVGPAAPVLKLSPPEFHEIEPPAPGSMRRIRRIDLFHDGGVLSVDHHFRDSYVDPDLDESVIHEYSLTAHLDAGGSRFIDAAATARVLPLDGCPGAIASAHRLVGQSPAHLRRWVRDELRGVTTCTHLNDMMRSLADLPSLLSLLPR